MPDYPKRLIEVDLPIKRISAHSRREKSIRHGHISTLHIWWARRPLAACRAVICAALWPDPADDLCPKAFREAAERIVLDFARKMTSDTKLAQEHCSPENYSRWVRLSGSKGIKPIELRGALLDFIADFANWDNSTVREYLDASRALTQAAHESLGGAPGTRPLVVDPFAGGGSIPLEALRVGADAFASDLNPVAVLLNKVVLEYIPKYGQKLADEVRKQGQWIKTEAEKELSQFYPSDAEGGTPIAYFWARTIQCEGPSCGTEIPLLRSLLLARKEGRTIAMRIVSVATEKRVDLELIRQAKPQDIGEGTIRRGSVTCPCCGYTTAISSVRSQLKSRHGGTTAARLYAVVTIRASGGGRHYRAAHVRDLDAIASAEKEFRRRVHNHRAAISLVPDEKFTGVEPRRIPIPLYGMEGFGDLFTIRQQLVLTSVVRLVQEAPVNSGNLAFDEAVRTCLALAFSRSLNRNCSLVWWDTTRETLASVFSRQALPMLWDFAEAAYTSGSTGSIQNAIDEVVEVLNAPIDVAGNGKAEQADASASPLPDGSGDAMVTDPPYYYSVPYSDLSDFFYVWLRRALGTDQASLFTASLTPKAEECVQNLPHSAVKHLQKDRQFFEDKLARALGEACRVTKANGVGLIVFAHSTTEAWESVLAGIIRSGWLVTGSWPIDTEMGNRVISKRQSILASSVHLVCRPRISSGSNDSVGDWRDVLAELPKRIREWMPRLSSEGVVGADAIFACLGPALEIFSRYSRVEKSSGEAVTLKEYLEHVWAAVANEALSLIFKDSDAAGLEPDARLTAMWLWTVGAKPSAQADEEDDGEDEEAAGAKKPIVGGFSLEYDAARKIAQGLGVHLEKIPTVVEVKGETARLLPVAERSRHLFGKTSGDGNVKRGQKVKKSGQSNLFGDLYPLSSASGHTPEVEAPQAGATVLDRVHQSMLLFAGGRGDALKRFLVEDGAGKDGRFWKLAQSLSALYPAGTDEKRWVDGVLARKKGLGL